MIANLYRVLKEDSNLRIIVCSDMSEVLSALEVAKYLKLTSKNFPNFYFLSDFRAKKGDDLRSYSLELSELLVNLASFYRDKNAILFAPLHSILHSLPRSEMLENIVFDKSQKYDFLALKAKLIFCGFEIQEVVHAPKEMAIHGDIIDIFAPNLENPIRVSFFDDEIESIRYFDIVSQMCLGDEIDKIELAPAFLNLDESSYKKLDELAQNSDYDAFIKDIISLGFWFLEDELLPQKFSSILTPRAKAELSELSELEYLKYINFGALDSINVIENIESYSEIIPEPKALNSIFNLHKNKSCTLFSLNPLFLNTLNIPPFVRVLEENISLNIITPDELILSLNKIKKAKKKISATVKLNELNKGDFVVHSDYGIGIFDGIAQAKILGNVSDFIRILYANDDVLLLPTYNLHLMTKYVANTSSAPVLDKLGKSAFARVKERIKPKLFLIAQEIIDIAAARELIKGNKIDTNNVELEIFKFASEFNLTKDQERSIGEIFGEISSGKVMDRLLIGDVGFGKTEVAMNAMFATIKSGFQACLIVPTTLLASQHFKTLQNRFAPFNIKIARLDRTTANKTKILDSLKNGEIEIVVGTHSLLNAEFKNLGLVVLDEEHKFGVKQKEALKVLTKNTHILSMSATPIPRTLNLALSQIKTKSELNTPPDSRIAPKTFVKNYSDFVLKDAILRELRRNGQIFYIHNNIANMLNRKSEILKLMPKLKIAVLHSKISQNETEEIMLKFANGEFDMLLCTSIVESGIHLPNANTILVDDADRFGMADLHQLRGRIGRGNVEGYCYFFIEDKESLTKEARARLLGLESNSFLGAGGILSYADLEIRGGGNILGEAQSGHIKHIGYNLYLSMLEDCINELSGKALNSAQSVDIKLNISAFLNADLIPSDRIRLDFYRRLSNVESREEIFEIEREIVDRFGKLDDFSARFLQLIMAKFLANCAKIKNIMNYNRHITMIDSKNNKIQFDADEIDDNSVLEAVLAKLKSLN